jgi:spore coat polysaccharide biosynthesis predicted glycosyltransferase SpsG
LNKKLLSLTENTVKSGMGHYMRQTALRNYLLKQNIDLCLVSNPDEYFKIEMERFNPNLVLVDLSEGSQTELNLAALDFKNKFCFDWSASQTPDINVIISEWSDKNFGYKSEKYSGFQYLVVSEDVFSVSICEKDYCLITVGAYLSGNILSEILKKLKSFYFGEILLIESRVLINLTSGKKLSDNLSRKEYLGYLAHAELVLTNGGTTLVESCLLKKKIISVPKNKYEFGFAQSINDVTPLFAIWNVAEAHEKVTMLNPINSKIDGLGTKRVGDIILNKIFSNE